MSGWQGHRIAGAKLAEALADVETGGGRLPLSRDLTRSQLAVAALSSAGLSAAEVGKRLGCTVSTVRFFIEEAAERIPGHRLAARAKVIAWYCGASEHVLGADRE